MPYPRLDDDGATVTLDLHGARLEEADAMARRLVQLAAARGRRQVVLIHGRSERAAGRETIRDRLHALIDEGALQPHVLQALREGGRLLLGLDLSARVDPARIRLSDLRL